MTDQKIGSGRGRESAARQLWGPGIAGAPQPFSLLGSDGRDHGLEIVPSLSMLSVLCSKQFAGMLRCAGLVLV